MKTRTTLNALLLIAFGILLTPAVTVAQEGQPLYVSVDCMKSTATDYTNVETDIWQPMHQELVNRGKRNSWALYRVQYGDRSKCDFYTVTTYLGNEQLNVDPAYEDVFEAIHGKKGMAGAMARTLASREHVATELWVALDRTEMKPHRFAIVNLMYAEDPDVYERMESSIFKPVHQALVDSGYRAGWGVYALMAPTGTSTSYNYSTVDFVNEIGPVPMAESLLAAHPDRDLETLHEMLELREQVSSETWELVAATEQPQ